MSPALALLLLLGPALVQPAPRAPRQLPVWTRPAARTRANAKASEDGLDFVSFLSRAAGLATQLVGPQWAGTPVALVQLGALVGADAALTLFAASAGASSGGYENPAVIGTDESSEEVADLEV